MITSPSDALVNSAFSVTFTFSENVFNFEEADVSLTNATIVGGTFMNTVAGLEWIATINPTMDGAVAVEVPAAVANDLAGNDNNASGTFDRTFDGTNPTVVSITTDDTNPTLEQQVNFRVTFDEDVLDVEDSDFEIVTTGTITGESIVNVTEVTADVYLVRVDRGTGLGTFGLNLRDDDSITDNAGNPLGGTGVGNGDFTGEIYDTNRAPTDITLSSETIDENSGMLALVGDFASVDADGDTDFIYTFATGTGDDDNDDFEIVDDQLFSANDLNFEERTTYSIRVQTDDQKGGLFEKAFTITVNNVNETPFNLTLSNNDLLEADDPGVLVGILAVEDFDVGDTFTFTRVTGDGDNNNLLFQITNGNELRTAGATNFEEDTELNVRIRATDEDGLFVEMPFVIDVENVEIEPLRDFDTNEPDARVRNFFSPNGDGDNDTWIVEDILDNPINEVKVYSQAGKLIFSQRNYENDWDGTFDGEPIPPGTYYYEINIYNGESIIRGFLTIIRQ